MAFLEMSRPTARVLHNQHLRKRLRRQSHHLRVGLGQWQGSPRKGRLDGQGGRGHEHRALVDLPLLRRGPAQPAAWSRVLDVAAHEPGGGGRLHGHYPIHGLPARVQRDADLHQVRAQAGRGGQVQRLPQGLAKGGRARLRGGRGRGVDARPERLRNLAGVAVSRGRDRGAATPSHGQRPGGRPHREAGRRAMAGRDDGWEREALQLHAPRDEY
eukprot:scaffold11694_cov63-Phaeocystis_antarctica.AAC.1